MSREVLSELEALLREAFEGASEHSLLRNVEAVGAAEWEAVAAGGGRTVGAILAHVGWAKWMYDDYAFRAGEPRGDQPPMWPAGGRPRRRTELLAWLREGQARVLDSVAGLGDDAELDREWRTNWGALWPTRRPLWTLVAHDGYHAGEINHLRAVLRGNDRFPNED